VILEELFLEYARGYERAAMISEFYGTEYALFNVRLVKASQDFFSAS